jgi:hypothetical protein
MPLHKGVGTTLVVVVVVVVLAIATIAFVMLINPTIPPVISNTSSPTSTSMTFVSTTTMTSSSSNSATSSPTTSTTSSSTTSAIDGAGENCPMSYFGLGSVNPTQTYPSYPVLSMPTNSNAVVCVTYYNPTNTTKTLDLGDSLGIEIGSFYSQTTAPNTIQTSFNQSSHFTVTANVTSVVLGPNGSRPQTVAFLIHSDSGSKGFFYLNVGYLGPESCDMGLPIAVGYSFTPQNESGAYFNPGSMAPLCYNHFVPAAHSDILGFIGIAQTYVDCGAWICDQTS